MDSAEILKMVFGIVGGLGIFLLGMKNMSEGMQAVAGDRLRKLIGAITNNRFMACGVGTAVTCLIQSSSITTVMVVGMVNASLMTLMQAIGVILGANIGTTITGWILVLKVGKYGLPILGVAAFFYLFAKRDRLRFTAGIFLGLGMVFYGLMLMKDGFKPLRELPEFIEWFSRFSPTTYLGVLRCCLVGAVLTAIVQSSSATLGITIGLAMAGVIDFHTAAALVLGENIGTTITAYLASLGASSNAKRAAYAHMLINVIGVLWITAIFRWYMIGIEWFIGADPNTMVDGNYPYITSAIAITHTGFNVVNVIIFLPLMGFLSKVLYKMVPQKAFEEIPRLKFINIRMLDTPALSMQQSQAEILRMGELNVTMLDELKTILAEQKIDKDREELIFSYERDMDVFQKEVVEFISNTMSGNVSHEITTEGRNQLRIADEYESVSDYITTILKVKLKIREARQQISEEGLAEILDLHDKVLDYVKLINEAAEQKNTDILQAAQTQSTAITILMKKYRSNHLERVGTGATTPLKSLMFMDMLNSYRRIKDHCLNIAEVLSGEK